MWQAEGYVWPYPCNHECKNSLQKVRIPTKRQKRKDTIHIVSIVSFLKYTLVKQSIQIKLKQSRQTILSETFSCLQHWILWNLPEVLNPVDFWWIGWEGRREGGRGKQDESVFKFVIFLHVWQVWHHNKKQHLLHNCSVWNCWHFLCWTG